ncbi:hypothetical protein L6452_38585 [Arctium lappa]|uniref:Uncharacterized protein n=1 Tax=Arctium lappa TaxID=4217 RepID=A0ACB8XQP7_ARCLA|nr:hypothetical protein L6452_38585 [Arctium lappa]
MLMSTTKDCYYVVDLLAPYQRGGKIGLYSGAGVGKNVIIMELIKNRKNKCALVYGQMNEPPGSCAHVGLTRLTVAEHFRDAEGQDVPLFIDNIFLFYTGPGPATTFAHLDATTVLSRQMGTMFMLLNCMRASHSIQVKRCSEAINDLNVALEAEPSLYKAYWSRASVLRHLCRKSSSLSSLLSSIRNKNHNTQRFVNITARSSTAYDFENNDSAHRVYSTIS